MSREGRDKKHNPLKFVRWVFLLAILWGTSSHVEDSSKTTLGVILLVDLSESIFPVGDNISSLNFLMLNKIITTLESSSKHCGEIAIMVFADGEAIRVLPNSGFYAPITSS